MTNPIERAAEALPPFPGPSDTAVARAAFESIDVDELAEALWASVDGKGIDGRLYRRDCDYLARVMKERLTKGDENDE